MLNSSRRSGARVTAKCFILAALTGAACFASACSSDSTPSPGSGDSGAGGGGSGGKAGSSGAGGKAGSSGTGGSAGSSGTGGSTDSGDSCTGAPSKGMNDDSHCKAADGGPVAQATGKCVSDTGDAGATPVTDAGAEPGDGGAVSDYGDTLYGTEGDDDDCKYHVSYTVAPICEKEGVTFTVTVTNTADGKPTTGAHPYLELTLNDLPPSVADKQKATEKAGGVYDIGPVMFDKPGKWVARFHFFEECSDEPEDSPHGHIAFYMDVP